ncbi:MAG: PEP-CTERM sorting domain-containing protein [Cyanobacteria bacterium P01_A01_bin.17]
MKYLQKGLLISSVAIAMTVPKIPAEAVTLSLDGNWVGFQFGGVGSIGTPTFQFEIEAGNTAVFDVTDAFLAGDVFEVVDTNLGSLGATSFVPADGSIDEFDPDVAFSSPNFSSGTFLLEAGQYDISLVTTESPFGAGGAFVRVPEPITILGTVLLTSLGIVMKRSYKLKSED